MKKLLGWFIDTYAPDLFVAREDFDHVQNREFPIMQRLMAEAIRQVGELQRENHKLRCDGLYNSGFLPSFVDAERGQIDVSLKTVPIREQFCTKIQMHPSHVPR